MKLKPITIKTLCALSLSLAMPAAFAGNITDINVSSLPDNQKIIKIKFDKDVVSPSGFITTTPARIALDFPGTGIQLAQPVLEYADPLLGQITAAQNNDRARILLALSKAGQYNTQIKGNEVWVYVSEAAEQTQTIAAAESISSRTLGNEPVAPPAPRARAEQAVAGANIDFRRGNRNSGIIEFNAPAFTGEPDIKQQSDRLVITLKNYPLPAQAQRSLDVSDFNTPVRNVTLKRIGNNTQLTIRNQGSWDVRTQSGNGRYSFEISQKSNMESRGLSAAANQKSFSGRRISLDFQDVDVRTILQILAKESGVNIVASDSVNGKMTLSLKDVPWDQALDLVMQARNLDMRRQGNIINIAPREELLNQDKATLQAQKEIEELGPLFSQTFQLKYKNVEEFRKILRIDEDGSSSSSNRNTLLSSRGSALIDPATNTLIITDNRAVIQKFQKLIEELDVAARQVMVEARIVEADDGFSREIGVKFGYAGSNGTNSWGSNWSNALTNHNTYQANQRARDAATKPT
jgi:type IV pilus assembly protein PilQ